MEDEKYYSVKNVSDKYNIGVSTVNKWIREGKLRAIKLGDVWRIPQSALDEFIQDSHNKR